MNEATTTLTRAGSCRVVRPALHWRGDPSPQDVRARRRTVFQPEQGRHLCGLRAEGEHRRKGLVHLPPINALDEEIEPRKTREG